MGLLDQLEKKTSLISAGLLDQVETSLISVGRIDQLVTLV